MPLLNLTGLERALEQPTPFTGQVTIEYVAGRRGYVEIDGEKIILPKTITVAIVNGIPEKELDLDPTRGFCAARITVSAVSGAYKRRDVAIPDQPEVDYGDLVDVDPSTFEPSGEATTAWLAAVGEVETLRAAVALDAEATAADRAAAGTSAFNAGTSAAAAQSSETDAAGFASAASSSAGSAAGAASAAATAASAAETARAAAVVAKNAAEAVPTTTDGLMTAVAGNPGSAFAVQQAATFVARVRGDVVVDSTPPVAAGAVVDEVVAALPSRAVTVVDSVHEWWCHPIASRVGRKTYGAGYSSIGEVLAWDRDDREGLKAVVVGDAGAAGPGSEVDDHDAPARWTADDGSFSVMFWTNHGDTADISVRPSLDGTAAGFLDHPTVNVQVAPGAAISYTQAFLHSVVGEIYTFWVFTRSSNSWPVQVITVDRVTGAVTAGVLHRSIMISAGSLQAYVTAVQDGRKIRFAAYVNPASDVHAIWLLHLDMDTLTITSPVDGVLSHLIDSGAYLDLTGQTPFVPETSTTGRSRRLFYPHPTDDRLLFAEWVRGVEDEADYVEAVLHEGDVFYRELGVAGPRNGYTAAANYIPGACYSPDGSLVFTLHNTAAGGEIHAHSPSASWVTRKVGYKLSRPVALANDELMWLAVDHYTDYFSFLMHQVSQVGFPVIEDLPVDPELPTGHPLAAAGTVLLIDPTYESWALSPWPVGVPTEVDNLGVLVGGKLTVASSVTSGFVERTAKGGLHAGFDQGAGTGNQSLTLSSADVRAAIAAQPTHLWYVAASYAFSEAPASGYAPAVGHRMVGVISTGSADQANVRVGPTRTVVDSKPDGTGTRLGSQAGTTTPADGPQLVDGAFNGYSNTVNASNAMIILHNGGAASPAGSKVLYFAIIEDLTVSGRDYATVHALVQALHNEVHGVGGRYDGDTWTTP